MPGDGNYSPNESQEEAPPERGASAALGAVLLGPRKAPLVPPAIHAAQHERAGRDGNSGCVRDRLYRWPWYRHNSQRLRQAQATMTSNRLGDLFAL